MPSLPPEKVRLDKWLWAARYYKTRSDATDAVLGGKVEVNGDAAKPAKLLQIGDMVRVRKAPYEFMVEVIGMAERRGSAEVAATLFQETTESVEARERLAEQLRLAPQLNATGAKPSRQDRKAWDRFRGKG